MLRAAEYAALLFCHYALFRMIYRRIIIQRDRQKKRASNASAFYMLFEGFTYNYHKHQRPQQLCCSACRSRQPAAL